jgi:hypothetical protein
MYKLKREKLINVPGIINKLPLFTLLTGERRG